MSNRSGEPYVEFVPRDSGEKYHEFKALTVEMIVSKFDRDLVNALKDELPSGTRIYDERINRWRIMPSYQEQAAAIAMRFVKHVYLTVDGNTTNLVTGARFGQGGLF
jgi:hypothetical protein